MADINRAEDYFRRSKDRGGDIKLLARGLLHLVKHLGLEEGRDFGRAQELLDRAWKQTSEASNRKNTAHAMFLVARGLKGEKRKEKKEKEKSVKGSVIRNIFGLRVTENED
jgi:hypothetical protein